MDGSMAYEMEAGIAEWRKGCGSVWILTLL